MSITSQKDVLTLCLRLCLEPSDSHSPDTLDVLNRYRPAWEAAAGGMDPDQALALLPKQDGPHEQSTGGLPDRGATSLSVPPSHQSEAGADDTRRMDWLDKKDGAIHHLGYGEYRDYFGPGHGTARTRIDAAMEQDRRSATDSPEGEKHG